MSPATARALRPTDLLLIAALSTALCAPLAHAQSPASSSPTVPQTVVVTATTIDTQSATTQRTKPLAR